nr:MBL fold metallo-hydrolase [Desulfobacterales bacterium]
MKTTFTILCENTAAVSFKIMGEHGLSILIERGEEAVLMDTGQGMAISNNLDTLKKDISRLKAIVLSHGHFDHTGGLMAVLGRVDKVPLYAHPDAFSPRYAQLPSAKEKKISIGIPFERSQIESAGAVIHEVETLTEISPGIYVSGVVERPDDWKSWDERLVVPTEDGWQPDPFLDDFSMVVETDSGPVVLLGCAHAGLEFILKHLQEKGGWDQFYAVLGGTHLGVAGPEEWEKALILFEKYNIQRVGSSHCTGMHAATYLAQRLNERFFFAQAGISVSF